MDKIPVYIFSGLLDSGKTTSIKSTLYDERFNEGEKSLIVSMEDGDTKFDERFLKKTNCQLVELDSLKEFTIEKMKELDKKYNPDRVFIELNGTDDDKLLYQQGFYDRWDIAQHLVFIDASTFKMFVTNMKQFIYNHVFHADLCVFNRCDNQDKIFLRNNIKGINPKLQVLYENTDGTVTNKIDQDLFDVSKPINISDDDFGLWYMDQLDNPEKYDKATITLKLRYIEPNQEYSNVVYMGRNAMVCCSNDVAPVVVCIAGIKQEEIEINKFYTVTGRVHVVNADNGEKTCVLYSTGYELSKPMEDELVYFN